MQTETKDTLAIVKEFQNNNDFDNAIECCKNIINAEPENYSAWFNLAMSLKNNGQVDDSIIAYEKALAIKPESPTIYNNLGNIYFINKNDPQTTTEYYQKLVKLEPENIKAQVCLAVAYLKTKNYKDGWKFFEARLKDKAGIALRINSSEKFQNSNMLTHNQNITDKTIYVYYEGGIGDTIMFSRFLPLLKNKCKKVLFRPQTNCFELFKNNLVDIEVLDIKTTDDMLDFDYHLPLMSLPYILDITNEKDIPVKERYLNANPSKVEFYKKQYFNNQKFKIGIKWQGNTNVDKTREISTDYFSKLFDIPNTAFYSLQKGNEPNEFQNIEIIELAEIFNDFSDTAAAIENLDLIICNDTSVGHLAGAMGKPCWILLPYVQDWRWSTDISYCIWYNSVKLFRQNEPDNWGKVFDDVYVELRNLKAISTYSP